MTNIDFQKLNDFLNDDLKKILQMEAEINVMKGKLPKSFLEEVKVDSQENFDKYLDKCYKELDFFVSKVQDEIDETEKQYLRGLMMAYSKLLGAMSEYQKSLKHP